jgi:hypothetical protein
MRAELPIASPPAWSVRSTPELERDRKGYGWPHTSVCEPATRKTRAASENWAEAKEQDGSRNRMNAVIYVFWCTLWTLFGALIGSRRERPGAGALFGFLLGPIGCLIAFCLKDARLKCPHCAEAIQPEASICPHCRGIIREAPPLRKAAVLDPVDDWDRRTSAAAKTQPCPSCRHPILISTLRSGMNTCQACGNGFKVDFE